MSRYYDLHNLTDRVDSKKTAGTASFVVGAVATFDDGDLFVTTDGEGTTVTFEIDATGGNTPDPANVEIDISAAGSAADVADLIRIAIEASDLNITTDAYGSATVNLTQSIHSFEGNNSTPTYTPAAAGTGISSISVFAGATRSHSYKPAPGPHFNLPRR